VGERVAAERSRLPFAALGFAVAAAFSSWNPLAAPFGLVVGLAAVVLSLRALAGPGRRAVAASALAVSLVAAVGSAVVIALTAGVGHELGGTPVVPAPGREDVARELDEAAERTRAGRERARKELESLEPAPAGSAGPAPRGTGDARR
jgi:hypothetical protein